MAKKFRRKEGLKSLSEINITPLLDLAFALLIIFMIATPLLQNTQSISVNLPSESSKPQSPPPQEKIHTIAVDASGQIFFNTLAVTTGELDSQLKILSQKNPSTAIAIHTDHLLPCQKLVDVLDLLSEHKLTKIAIATKPR